MRGDAHPRGHVRGRQPRGAGRHDGLAQRRRSNECWTFYRQPSGGLSIAKLDSGDLDIALLGSTPYAAAAARRGRLKAVSVAHLKGSSQALITRAEFTSPRPFPVIRSRPAARPRRRSPPPRRRRRTTSRSPSSRTPAWILVKSTSSSCRRPRSRPPGILEKSTARASGARPSRTSSTTLGRQRGRARRGRHHGARFHVAHWDYLTGNVLAASDAFLNDHPDLVKKLVARFEQTRYDYRSKEEGSLTRELAAAGSYNQKVTDFASLTTAQDAADVFDRLAKFEYLSVAEQRAHALGEMTQDSAYFFFEQKVLAEDPSPPTRSFYTALYDTTALTA